MLNENCKREIKYNRTNNSRIKINKISGKNFPKTVRNDLAVN